MNGNTQKYKDNPDSVDFIIRRNEITESLLKEYDLEIALTLSERFSICYTSKSEFERLRQSLGAGAISNLSIILGLLDTENITYAGIKSVHTQPFLNLRGKGTLIAIIDSGIDYTSEAFRYEDGSTKIKYIFDQTAMGNTPEGYPYGAEYTSDDINKALASDNPYEMIPETDEAGHGTFLASVAAGIETTEYTSAAPDAEIIAVKLKKARQYYLDLYSVPESQPYAYESSSVMIGIDYALRKAQTLGRPLSICLGLGSNFGSHDAYSIFEEYLTSVATLNGVCLCVACGNESQARHHTSGKIEAQGETKTLNIKTVENSGDVYLSVWTGVSDRISVSVRSPTGELVPRVPARNGSITETPLVIENSAVRIVYYYPVEGSGGQLTAVKLINPTAGIWTVTLYGDIILDGKYDSWLPMTGFVKEGVEFLSANPDSTITVPATMTGAITVGGYDYATNSLYADSSWGPTRMNVISPDLCAPAVNVGGFYPGGYGYMSGTSVATAITAGAAALMLEWGIVNKNDTAISTYQIRAYLIRGCRRNESMSYPNNRLGYGVLNLLNSFELMREI